MTKKTTAAPKVKRTRNRAKSLGQFNGMTTEQMLLEVARANLSKYGTVTPPYEAMLPVMRATCPRCDREGPVLTDFGLRSVRGKIGPQSWCRACRNSPASHPSRGG